MQKVKMANRICMFFANTKHARRCSLPLSLSALCTRESFLLHKINCSPLWWGRRYTMYDLRAAETLNADRSNLSREVF